MYNKLTFQTDNKLNEKIILKDNEVHYFWNAERCWKDYIKVSSKMIDYIITFFKVQGWVVIYYKKDKVVRID